MVRIVPERNGAQFQPITTALRGIIKEYHDGGGVLRELCQNADDAGATEIEFVLDRRQHTTQNILHDGLAEYQGVSLLAFNNRKFSRTDFDSLSRVGDSAKAKDPSSTGKFGRGFNSVYNWTDTPSILSGSSLLILDPHHTWSASPEVNNPGGPLYDFVKYWGVPEMQNQLSAFSSLLNRFDTEFDGTIIRLPLRTQAQVAKSKIVLSDKHTTEEKIIDIFHKFSGELVETLLFLKNLRTITLRIDDQIYAKATSTTFLPSGASGRRNENQQKADINASYKNVFVAQESKLYEVDFEMDVSFYRCYKEQNDGIENTQNFKYVISHQLRRGPRDPELQRWARSRKLFPWTAIATPLEGNTEFRGHLFSILPLPVHTKHPVHIHGMFSISPDRRSIHSGSDKTNSEDSEAQWGTKWNDWLFQECIPQTWIRNLDFLRTMNENGGCSFGGWDFWPAGSEGGWKEVGMGVFGKVFERVVRQNMKLLPTVYGTTGTRENVLFSLEIGEELKSAFENAGVPVVIPPQDRRYEIDKLRPFTLELSPVTPSTARERLTILKDSLKDLPLVSRMTLLHFIISDEDFREIGSCTAPLIPAKDGTFRSFGFPAQGSSSLFLSRDENEDKLFRKYTNMVDLSTTLSKTKKLMRKNIFKLHKFTAVRMWDVENAALYCSNHIFNSLGSRGMADVISEDGIHEFVDQLWQWINHRCKPLVSVANSSLRDLWLLPLMTGEYRKLSSTITVLDVSGNRGVGAFIWATADSHWLRYKKKYCLFTGKGFSLQTGDSLRRCGFVKDYEDIISLMKWLVANSGDFVDQLNNQEKVLLLQHLNVLSKNCLDQEQWKAMRDGVSKLSLFQEAAPLGSSECPWISLDSVNPGNLSVAYVGIKNVPVALQADKTVFIDISNSDTRQLVTGLGLATCPLPTELFERYVIPGITAIRDSDSRASLVEYVLQNFDSLSVQSKEELSNIEIVPVLTGTNEILLKRPGDTVAPNSAVSSLFFSTENRVPLEEFCRRYHSRLLELGMVGNITKNVVLERITEYSSLIHPQQDVAEKAQLLITGCRDPPLLSPEILQSSRWIPARTLQGVEGLYSADDCRDRSFDLRVKYVMPLVYFPVNNSWMKCLGWDSSLPMATLLKQLEEAAKAEDNITLEHLIKHKHIGLGQCPLELKQIPWIPSASGGYYPAANIFFDDFRALSPHFGTIDNRFKKLAKQLFNKLGVQTAPSFQRLNSLQDELASKGGSLEQADLEMSLFIVKEVGKRYAKKEDLATFKAPDNTGHFHVISELTAGDPGNTETNGLKILHQGVSLDTAKQLGLATFKDRFLQLLNDPEFEEDFAQRESPMAVIEDTLARYPVRSTFNEYLANAEDSGSASKICWILDESDDYPKTNLLSQKLADLQGPALFCYNDGCFSENDFKGIINIGIGSKRDDPSKIGKFGKGALTMYHWTSVPSFISGEYYVIFDPEKKYLPEHPVTKRPRGGMKLKIEHVREQWPEQLQPFEGILKFDKDSKSFPGTIFRFPLPRSGKLHVPAKISTLEARRHLDYYFEEANTSLLFLEKVSSISFWDKLSKVPNWSVRSKQTFVAHEPGISHITISGRSPSQLSDPESDRPNPKIWCVISGKTTNLPSSLVEVQKKERLEASYSLAALFSGEPVARFSGRHFVGLPLQGSSTLGIPVHVNADTIIQSNRQSISIEQKDEGSEWNKWIFEKGVAQGYLKLVKYLMQMKGVDGYRYWPEYQPRAADTASKIISTAFWELVTSSQFCLYPPKRLASVDENGGEYSPANLSLETGIFNLLDSAESTFVLPILSKWGLENIVVPDEMVQNALRDIQPSSMKSITPEYLLRCLRLTPRYRDELLEIWAREHKYKIDFFNRLLSFVTNRITLSSLIGCGILPLANCTLGTFLPAGASQTFLVAATQEESGILEISQDLVVHPGLGQSIVDRLVSCGVLNIARFDFEDISRLHPALEEQGVEFRKAWLAKVWLYLKSYPQRQRGIDSRIACLQHMPIYFGKVVGEPDENCVFICPSEFQDSTHPAILEPLEATRPERLALESLKGLILLNRSAFPETGSRQESMRTSTGVYRLLKCIELLARKNGLFIEEYLIKTVPAVHITALRSIFTPEIMSEILQQHHLTAKEYLRQLPIWPVSGPSNPQLTVHRPATKALLPPYPVLSSSGMTTTSIFIEKDVTRQYGHQLEKLGVKRMLLDDFLRSHVGVSLNQKISSEKKPRYYSLMNDLFKVSPQAFSRYPLAVDGNERFQMANSLYLSEEPIFKAAFRDLEATHFLHADYRGLNCWKNSSLLRGITEGSYLECARSIERRGSEVGVQDQLIADARTVSEHLCWDTRETQSWNPNTWRELSRISFVPIQTLGTGNPSHRIPRMQELMIGKKLTKITEAVIPEYTTIAWSQFPILERSPSSYAQRKMLAGGGIPSSSTVINHLIFLSNNRFKVEEAQIPAYVLDIKASYLHLQNLAGMGNQFSVLPEAEIWFNAEAEDVPFMTKDMFQASWASSMNLCIGLEYDSPSLRQVRSYLTPFQELLVFCRVNRIKAPVIPRSLKKPTDHTSLMLKGLQRLRKEGRSFDVKLVVGGQTFNAHWTVLSAVSGYFDRMYTSGMREAAERTITFPPGSDIGPKTVSILLDYIYTGEVPNVEFSDSVSDDLDDIIEQLYVSNLWQLDELKNILEEVLCNKHWIRPETVRAILKCAEEVCAETLVRVCSQYISDNREIIQREDDDW